MKSIFTKLLVVQGILFFLMCTPLSAEIKISVMPQPPPSAKLRVLAVILTHDIKASKGPKFWLVSPEEMTKTSLRAVNNIFKAQGIYEVVKPEDVSAAIGGQSIASWEWTAKDYALAKDVGRALYADYVFVLERSFRVHLQIDMNLINMGTGRQFSVSNYVPADFLKKLGSNDQRKRAGAEAIKISYSRLFADARRDLLRTALLKGKISGGERQKPAVASLPTAQKANTPGQEQPAATVKAEKQPGAAIKERPLAESMPKDADVSPAPSPIVNRKAERQMVFEKELKKKMTAGETASGGPRLVVYDFEAADRLKIVGLILTEALREELHNAGGFILVNRENMLKIMDEYKLQQSGAVDEQSAVKMGQWLAASEAVTGSLGALGSTSILQVKRIDIKTLGTIALGSLKCPSGKEDELLEQMPKLAHKLSKKK